MTIEPTTKILVVDDDPNTARVVSGWYQGRPVQVLEARDGDEGVRLAVREKPDIILMDLMMPRTNGFEASRRLRADPSTMGRTRVVTLAWSRPADVPERRKRA